MSRFKVISLFFLFLSTVIGIQAQDNLLRDPSFEGDYTGRGRSDFNIPADWGGWWTNSPSTESWMNVPPIAFPHTGTFKRSGGKSLNVGRGDGTFTAAIYQQVADIPAGAQLTANAWVFLESVAESNPQVRIGIGNNAGDNPFNEVTWSSWYRAVNTWQQVTVSTTATGGEVTVFIYTTQIWPNNPNAAYLDDATLVITGTGEVPVVVEEEGGDAGVVVAAPTSPPIDTVPFVSAQDTQGDGAIIHTVQTGDTVSAIAVAYGVPASEILELNGLDRSSFLQIGQKLIIQPAAPAAETSPEATSIPEVTSEVTVVDVITAVPTTTQVEIADDEPTEIPTLAFTPTITPIPPTATPAATAPVVSGETGEVMPADDPTSLETSVCVEMFEDANQNRIRELSDTLRAGGSISLFAEKEEIVSIETTSEHAVCLDTLSPGNYSVVAIPPEGYDMTTPGQLDVIVEPASDLLIQFGVAEGIIVATVPTAEATEEASPDEGAVAIADDAGNGFFDISGMLVFGLAGVVLVVGLGFSVILRRR